MQNLNRIIMIFCLTSCLGVYSRGFHTGDSPRVNPLYPDLGWRLESSQPDEDTDTEFRNTLITNLPAQTIRLVALSQVF